MYDLPMYLLCKHFPICPRSRYLLFPRMGSPNQNEAIQTSSFFTKRLEHQSSPHPLTLQWLIQQQGDLLVTPLVLSSPKEPSLQCPCSSPSLCSRLIEKLSSRMGLQSTPTQHPDRPQDGSLSAASLLFACWGSKKTTWSFALKSLLCGVERESRLLFDYSFLVFLLHFFSVNRMIQMQSEQHFLHWCNGKKYFPACRKLQRTNICANICIWVVRGQCPSVFHGLRNHADKTLWALVMS